MNNGWEVKTLEEVTELITCGVAKRPQYVENGVPFLSAKNVKYGKVIWQDYKYVAKETHSELTKYNKPNKGDILYTRVGSYGEAAIIDKDSEFSIFVSLTLIKPSKNILNSFLKYYLNSDKIKSLAKKSISGSGVGNLNVGTVRKFPINIPPIPKQKHIVKILDKAFAAIDKTKANAEKNLQNSRELFDSYLNKVCTNPGEDWEERKLGKIATFRNGMNFTKGSKGERIKIVGVKNFQKSFWVPFEYLDTVTIAGKLKETDFLKEDDILAVRSNGNPELIGRTLLAGNVLGKVSHSGFTIRIRLNSKIIFPLYLCHYLKSNRTRKELVKSGTGVNIKSLNQVALSSLLISFPKSQTEQQTIVQKLDTLSTETKRLEAIYQQKLNDIEELKKAILQKAFNGEL